MVTGAAAVYMRQVGGWTGGGIHSEDWGMCATPSPSLHAQVLRIPELGLQGGAQLAADVEYFNNVMSALHGSPPGDLLTVQLFAGLPSDGFAEAAAQAAAEGGVDMGMLRALAGMRKVVLV